MLVTTERVLCRRAKLRLSSIQHRDKHGPAGLSYLSNPDEVYEQMTSISEELTFAMKSDIVLVLFHVRQLEELDIIVFTFEPVRNSFRHMSPSLNPVTK